jgi:hypothetical protein
MEEKEILQLIKDQMIQHFKDDSRNFDLINKTLERHEELMIINGDHLSNIRKDINSNKEANNKILAILEQNSKQIGTLDTKISSHDGVIKIITDMLPEIKETIGTYKSSGIIGKAVIGFVLGVPALAGCVAGIIYLVGLFNLKQ